MWRAGQRYARPRYSGGRKVLFDSPEELHLFEPGTLTPAPHVAEHIPDAGTFFVDWATRGLPADRAREIESAVNGRRCQNGWFPLESLDNIGRRGFWRGPLTYLARMTSDDPADPAGAGPLRASRARTGAGSRRPSTTCSTSRATRPPPPG